MGFWGRPSDIQFRGIGLRGRFADGGALRLRFEVGGQTNSELGPVVVTEGRDYAAAIDAECGINERKGVGILSLCIFVRRPYPYAAWFNSNNCSRLKYLTIGFDNSQAHYSLLPCGKIN